MFKLIIFFVLIIEVFQFANSMQDKRMVCACNRPRNSDYRRSKRTVFSEESYHNIPWQVSITWDKRYLKFPKFIPMCSGVILNENWILTSAKCLEMTDQLSVSAADKKSVDTFLIGFGSNCIQYYNKNLNNLILKYSISFLN